MSESRDVREILIDIKSELKEVKNLLKIISLTTNLNFKNEVRNMLNSSEKIKAYMLTDGLNSTRAISEKTGVTFSTISRWWHLWKNMGLVEVKGNRAKTVFTLEELGIDKEEYEYDDKNIISIDTFDIIELKNILSNKNIFTTIDQLENISFSIFNKKYNYLNRNELINNIIEDFKNSTNKVKMLFLQALRYEINKNELNKEFIKYFEKWEKNIKGE